MRLLKQLAVIVFWFFLWTAIPAALLYPFALWMERHTRISGFAVAQGYVFAICLLFLPTGFLVDFMYQHFVRDRQASKSPYVIEAPK